MSLIAPEARFVVLCTQQPDVASPAQIRAAAGAVSDWSVVVELAAVHGVSGFVRGATDRAEAGVPSDADAALRHLWLGATAHVMSLNHQLERVVGAFAADGVPVIVLKGPALASTVYPSVALRPYGDLDLTVREDSEARAVSALRLCDFVEVPNETEVARLAHADHGADEGFHRLFVKKPEKLMVELHLDPLQLGLQPTGEAGRWARAVPLPGVESALMLCPEDQLIQLAVHVHKHGFSRLIWLKDLELLLRKTGAELNWHLVREVADLEGVRSSVWYSVHLAARLLGFAEPEQIRRSRPAFPVRALYGFVWPEREVANLAGRARWRSVQFRVADSWRGMLPSLILMGRRKDRARALARAVLHR